jgi:hypothetical protein
MSEEPENHICDELTSSMEFEIEGSVVNALRILLENIRNNEGHMENLRNQLR